MKKLLSLTLAFGFVAASAAVMAPSSSEAIPAFARQVGMSCKSCHFQHFPKLNAFGRAFKLGGMTDVGTEELLQDEGLNIPTVLNAAFMNKTSYSQASAAQQNLTVGNVSNGIYRGQFQQAEASIFVGGRVSENMGGMVELGIGGASAAVGGMKLVASYPVAFGKAGVLLWSTGGLGMGYGQELFNTGVVGNHTGFDNRDMYATKIMGFGQNANFGNGGGAITTSNFNQTNAGAAGAVAAGTAASSGVGVFAGSDLFYAQLTAFGPASWANGTVVDTAGNLSVYYRLAVTPELMGWQTMLGIFGSGGSTKLTTVAGAVNAVAAGAALATVNTNAFGIDAQAQGELAGFPVELGAAYISSGSRNMAAGQTDAYALGKAWDVNLEVAVLHNAGLRLGYVSRNQDQRVAGADARIGDFNATALGGYFELAQNVEISPEYTWYSGNGSTGVNGRPVSGYFNMFVEALF